MPETKTEDQLRAFFADGAQGVVCAYLFGSAARRDKRVANDIDLAVLYAVEPSRDLDGLGFELQGALERHLRREVDIVVLNRAPVDLIHRILRDGKLVYEQDKSARIRFEVKARAEYLDLAPYLREYRQSVR